MKRILSPAFYWPLLYLSPVGIYLSLKIKTHSLGEIKKSGQIKDSGGSRRIKAFQPLFGGNEVLCSRFHRLVVFYPVLDKDMFRKRWRVYERKRKG